MSHTYVKVGVRGNHRVDFLKPQRRQIWSEDIANGLAKSCRFQGHIAGWYSTAEHCLIGMKKARNKTVARHFLIHDAAEYVFCDIASPIKQFLPDYQKLEDEFQEFLNLMYCGVSELDPQVKEIDKRMCATEQLYMRDAPPEDIHAEPYDNVTFLRLDYGKAFELYLHALREYFPLTGW